jgi:hypothetical protein
MKYLGGRVTAAVTVNNLLIIASCSVLTVYISLGLLELKK